MSGLKFTLSEVTSLLPENLSKLKKKYIQVWLVHNIMLTPQKTFFCLLVTEM